MVTVQRGPNWKIAIYAADHGVPHFHLEGPGFRCSVAIATLEVIVGHAPARALAEALDWAADNRTGLRIIWQELNP